MQLNDENIDWEGNCNFDNDGNLLGFKTQSSRNHLAMLPIPESSAEMISEKEKLDEVMRPATKKEFSIIITSLSLHCGMQKKDPVAMKSIMRDYWHDMGDYPKYLIEEACAMYRRLPQGNDFMPSSGKLLSLVNVEYLSLKRTAKRLDRIINGEQPRRNERIDFPIWYRSYRKGAYER